MKRFLFLALLGASTTVLAANERATPTPSAAEITHLLDYLSNSRCQFERNGRRHGPAEARGHLERKLRHARRQDAGLSAEAFIAQAATGSSLTGKPYQVRCPGAPALPSADWFRAELQRFRADS
jgi:hypothetical protein